MSKKPKEIDFRQEAEDQLNAIKVRIGREDTSSAESDNY